MKMICRYHCSPIFLVGATIGLLLCNMAKGQEDLNALSSRGSYWLYFNNAPHSLYHHIAEEAFELIEKRSEGISKLQSFSDWQERQQWIETTLLKMIGPFPEKTPLNARISRTIKKDGFRVEHIIFESQPGFYVTSSLFIPTRPASAKRPAIIYCIGHSVEGYRSETYQHSILNLVRKGFIVFVFDPVGQGERIEYYDAKTKKSIVGGSTKEHSFPGTQAFITGSSQSRYMIWDGIRAVDYLLTRKEVDGSRIGITGGSGGGTQSALIAAFDKRIYASAPERYITNFKRLLQSIGPTDAEQSLYNAISNGIDHADLLIARAPKPALIISTTNDYFSIQGVRETAQVVASVYKAYGRENDFGVSVDDAPHASTKKNREAMYSFFQKHLGNPGNPQDEEVDILSREELQVTATGQVSTSYKGETVFSLNQKQAEKHIHKLQASRNDLENHLARVLSSAKQLSGFHEPVESIKPVFTGRIQREAYVIEKYFIQGEGDYVFPYLLAIPENSVHKALIYLHPSGKSAEANQGGEIEWFVQNGFIVLAPDMLGIGETGPGHFRGSAVFDSVNINTWYGSMLIGRSIAGIRAGDVCRLVDVLRKDSSISEIYGLARQEMSPVLMHAASFNQNISRIALVEPYSSYRQLVMNRFYNPKFIYGAVPGALKSYDLPDLAAALAPRKLLMISITDGLGKVTEPEYLSDDLNIIREAYRHKASGELLTIKSVPPEKYCDLYSEWMK